MSTQQTPDWLTLDEDEQLLWSTHPEIESYIPQFLGAIIFIPLFGLGLVFLGLHYLRLKNTEYVLTTKSIYRKDGIYSRSVQKIPLHRIQDTGYTESIIGRYFGFGTITISTAGSSGVELRLDAIANPEETQSRIEDASPSTTDESLTTPTQQPTPQSSVDTDALEAYVEEVKATRKSLETLRDNLQSR